MAEWKGGDMKDLSEILDQILGRGKKQEQNAIAASLLGIKIMIVTQDNDNLFTTVTGVSLSRSSDDTDIVGVVEVFTTMTMVEESTQRLGYKVFVNFLQHVATGLGYVRHNQAGNAEYENTQVFILD